MGKFPTRRVLSVIAVSDTNALIWHIFDSPRLSAIARTKFEQAVLQGDVIGFSSISLVEIVYLAERDRIPEDALSHLLDIVNSANPILAEIPVDRHIAQIMPQVERRQIPEMSDRIVAATALYLDVPVITSDRMIRSSDVETLW